MRLRHPDQAVLDRGIVADSFFSHVQTEGITLIEVCAGMASGLEAILLKGGRSSATSTWTLTPLP
jgi:hypothetical protein